MATKTITIKVNATDDGSLKKVVSQLKAAGIEVDKVATAHKRAGAAADDHHHRLAKGAAGIGNSTKSFSKMASTINGGDNSLVGAYAALAANIFAVTAAFNALKNAAEVEQVIKGLDASGVRMGLTYSVTTQKVRETADGLLSLEQSARSTAQVLAAGFKSDQVIRITEAAKNASFALGRDMSESMDRLTRGIIKLEPELLDELGIMVRIDEASSAYARTLGKTASQLTAAEKRQGFFNATLAEAELKFGGIADAAGGASGLTKLQATFSDLTNTIFKFINIAAKPLASMFAASPVSLVGGMLLFASSIKGQLMPGLLDMGDRLARVAKKAEELSSTQARAAVQSTVWGKKGSDAAKEYFASVESGTHTLASANAAINKIQSVSPSGFWKNIQTSEVKAIREIASAQAMASAVQHQADAVTLASQKNLKGSLVSLRASVSSYRASLELARISTTALSVSMLNLRVAAFAASAGIKVLGVGLLTMLPWIGVITIAVGALVSAFNFLWEKIVGKEVIVARKEFAAIMKSLTDKEAEYARIRASSASAASKEVAANILIANSINEQVTALEKLIEAESNRKKSKGGKDGTTITESASLIFSPTKEITDKGYAKVIKESLTSPIKEVRLAARDTIKELGGLPKVLTDTETAAKFLDGLKFRLGGVGDAAKRVEEAFKALNIATADFIKSATPSTPYDSLSKSLTETIISLGDLQVEFSKGADGAEKFNAILSGLGSGDAITILSAKSAKALQVYKETGVISARQVVVVQQELLARQQLLANAQNEAIVGASLVQLAQARVSKLNSFVALTASDTKKRMQAENAVLELQAAQLDAQVAVLKVMLEQAKARLEDNIQLRKSIDLMKDQSSIQQLSVYQTALATEMTKPKTAKQNEVIAELQRRVDASKAVVADEEKIRNLNASTTSLQNQAAAIRMGQSSKAVIDAEAEVTVATTALDVAQRKAKWYEVVKEALDYELKINSILGKVENQNYRQALLYVKDILREKKHELEAELALETAKIKAQVARGADKETLEARLELLESEYKQRILNLEVEGRAVILESLGTKTLIDRLELTKKYTDMLVNQADIISSNISAEAELVALKVRTAAKLAGRELTPTEERKLAFEIAEANLQAALDVQKLKELSIHAEYALLKAQYALEAMKLRNSNVDLQTELQAPNSGYNEATRSQIQATINVQTQAISAYEQAVGNLGAQQQAALRAIGINIDTLREAIKASGQSGRLSGVDTNPGASLAALESTDKLGNRTSNIGFNKETFTALSEDLSPFVEQLKKLGPDGEYVAAFVEGSLIIADSVNKIADAFEGFSKGMKFEDMMTNAKSVFEGISSIIGQIASITKAGSDAKIANIDREIAAEQQRDGKSEASLARIKAMESKKDSIARKSFETNKKLMMAQAVMATAAGVAGALAHMEMFPFNIALAGIIGAMGAAQLAIIAGTSYQSTSASASAAASPSAVSVGSRGNSVDLAKTNTNVGGELGYLQGNQGTGANSSNFRNRAYGGYGHAGMIVGEKGPEIFVPDSPGTMVANDNAKSQAPINANINIHAIDAEGVEQVLTNQKGHIIGMLREAANSNGQNFLESVNTAKYRRGGRRL